MSSGSAIEWTESTWNPVTGCSAVSEGCRNCYAVGQSYRNEQMGRNNVKLQAKYGGLTVLGQSGRRHFSGEVRCHEDTLEIPLRWKKPKRIFVNSMSDLFHEGVPFDFIDRVFAVMAICPQHTFQVLTKRPERMAEYLSTKASPLDNSRWDIVAELAQHMGQIIWDPRGSDRHNYPPRCKGPVDNRRVAPRWPLPNVWLGTSVENQDAADQRIAHLLRCPAAVRFLSCEPLLNEIDLKFYKSEGVPTDAEPFRERGDLLHWVIVGGESGRGARACSLDWLRWIVQQCKDAGVPCFVKQLGSAATKGRGKGGDMEQWPEELRVREYPAETSKRQNKVETLK